MRGRRTPVISVELGFFFDCMANLHLKKLNSGRNCFMETRQGKSVFSGVAIGKLFIYKKANAGSWRRAPLRIRLQR